MGFPMKQEVEILLVEDNPDDLELTLHALRREHLANGIAIAKDGEEALDLIFCRGRFVGEKPIQPKLILLDLKLPKVNGLEVLKEIKSNPTTASIPVVMLTASAEEIDLLRSYQNGVNSYLRKPVDFDEFRDMVKRIGFYWLVVNQTPATAPLAHERRG
jgi:CheY-like chemotaxis protein